MEQPTEAASATSATSTVVPTTNKYDRQLRLWGASGQSALANTCVVLVGTSAAGTETLKNLVLPGVGSIFVVEDEEGDDEYSKETSQSFTSNFFLPSAVDNIDSPKGPQQRAQLAMELLCELNPDVHGDFLSVQNLSTVHFLAVFQQARTSHIASCSASSSAASSSCSLLVVGSDLVPPLVDRLGQACNDEHLPLIVVQSYGLLGVVRLQTPPVPLIDTKPRDAPPDLRLKTPFPALLELYKSTLKSSSDWKNDLTSQQHGHIPYPFILLRASQEWKQIQQEKQKEKGETSSCAFLPCTISEKQAFQASIKALSSDFDKELNFQEAVQNAYLAYAERTVDRDHLQSLLNILNTATSNSAPTTVSLNNACYKFQLLLTALLQFLDRHDGQAPLQGTIPDMTSSSEWYVQLQTVYKTKALQDVAEMKELVLAAAARESSTTAIIISDEEITTFCQNVHHLDLFQPRTLQQENGNNNDNDKEFDDVCDDLGMSLMDEGDGCANQVPLLWYLCLGACRLFYQDHGRYPGVVSTATTGSAAWQEDIAPLQKCIERMIQHYKVSENELIQQTLLAPKKKDDDDTTSTDDSDFIARYPYAAEVARYANAELHTIASVVGGVASQEAVKLITSQYVPINNVYVYNGIASIGGVYRM